MESTNFVKGRRPEGSVAQGRRGKPNRTRTTVFAAALLTLSWLATPATGATLIDRWVADSLNVLNDGDTIGSWTSASNRIVTASTGNQPILKKGAAPSGNSVVRFNRHWLTMSANSPAGSRSAFSVVLVFKADAAGAGNKPQWYGQSGIVDAEQPGVTIDWGTVIDQYGQLGFGTGSPDTTTYSTGGPSLVDGNFHVAVFAWGSGVQSIYIDQRPVTSQSGVTTAARANPGLSIGSIHTGEGGTAQRFVGDLAEIRFYDTSLSATEAATVITELTDAYINANMPIIRSFTASTNHILIGATVTLAWNTTNAALLRIDNGVGTVAGPAGSVQVSPRTNTVYTLTASNAFAIRTAQVTVMVDQGAPVAHNQTVTTIQNTAVAITLTGADPNGGTLSYALLTPPAHGALSGTPPDLTYTPEAGYMGNDQFAFKVNDGEFDSPPGTVSLRVNSPPAPPAAIVISATNLSATAQPGSLLATLRAVDVNQDDTHTFLLVPGFGDNAQFEIAGNRLMAGPAFRGGAGAVFLLRVRATDNTGLSVEQNLALSVRDLSTSLVINEIHYNPATNTVREEFIELHNPTPLTMDVSWWRLAGGIDFVFPAGTVITSGGFLVVAQVPATLQSRYGCNALGPWQGALASEEDRVTLLDAAEQIVDEVNYRSEFPWPIAPNGGGASMALAQPALDNDLGSSWRPESPPSPGATNRVFTTNPPPQVRQVRHSPPSPRSTNQVVVTAKVTDPDGVAIVRLQYQIVTPGNFIPAILPLTVAQLNTLNSNPTLEPAANPVFENPANWITVPMNDDGLSGDAVAGDDVYTAVLPVQTNRVLVRYRIVVTDALGASRRAPFEDDPSLNFAYFVYDGVPAYGGISAAALQTLPVYFLLTRAQDFDTCNAYAAADKLPQTSGSVANEGRFAFNWPGAVVYDGEVYDHVRYRLRGANGRYHPGKRSFRIRFNDGRFLAAKDMNGNPYSRKWSHLTTAKGQSNRQTVTFGLNEALCYDLWNKVGVPAPYSFFFHWRVIRGAQEQPDLYSGDFYGMSWAQEEYDARFLEAHHLPKGNLYKLINAARSTDQYVDMQKQQRYQGPLAVTNGGDGVYIQNNLTGPTTIHDTGWLLANVNYPHWYRYHAIMEATRDYDFWPNCNKNAAWYFEPVYTASNNFFGRFWTLPWDATDTWGPTWNNGQDLAYNGIFPSSAGGGDSGQNLELQVDYFNTIRDVRDLLIQPDQVMPLIDAYAARLAAFVPADLLRWSNAPPLTTDTSDGAYYLKLAAPGPAVTSGLPGFVQDLKNFMFVGGTYSWWVGGTTIGAGGWATRLDSLMTDANAPAKPVISFAGPTNYPVDGLMFQTSAFSDAQGAGTFAALQWRVAEISPTNPPISDPQQLKFEWDAVWDSGPITVFTNRVQVPAASVRPGKLYRARVRHQDTSGRWSNWSAPAPFVPTPVPLPADLLHSLVISEILYHPPGDQGVDGDEFEFLELQNIGTNTLDLSGCAFGGISFTFTNGTRLAPGQYFVLGRNLARLQGRYPGLVVNGFYSNKLDNAGETLTLTHPYGTDILSVTYADRAPWPVTPDGYGFSLVRDPGAPTGYRASAFPGGSPGAADPSPTVTPIVLNEILSSAVSPAVDAIELYNPTPTNVDMGGWYLSDDAGYPWKFRLPATNLPPGGYVVFDENQFNPTPGTGTSFSLSSLGEEVYLLSADATGQLTGYSHGFAFGGAAPGVSFGRAVNSAGEEHFLPQISTTLGTNNAEPRFGPVLINEVHYHPAAGGDEFLELLNASGTPVPLYDPAYPTNTWRLSGLNYTFPTNVTLAPGALLLLVATNPADFRTQYAVPAEVQIFGLVPGSLQNSGERLSVLCPAAPATNGTPYFAVDEVRYHPQSPWPPAADGLGASLQRLQPAGYGSEPTNWVGAGLSPGRLYQGGEPPRIAVPLTSVVAYEYADATFAVQVAGTGPFYYYWMFGGSNVAMTTTGTWVLTNVQTWQQGEYSVVVLGAAGSTASSNVWLTVVPVPKFVVPPQGTNVFIGSNATFSVVATGTGPLSYQWRFNGVDLPGATAPTLTLSNVQFTHEGIYQVLVTDQIAASLSPPVSLVALVKVTVTQAPTNQTVLAGATAYFSISIAGYPPPFTYQFRRGSTPLTNVVSLQSNCTFTIPNVQYGDAGSYRIVIFNPATSPVGVSHASPAVLTVWSPPVLVTQPSNRVVNAGETTNLTVSVTGSTPFSYQWWRWGTNLVPGATNITLTATNIQLGTNDGPYQVVVSNAYGMVTSQVATLTVRQPPTILQPPTNLVVAVGREAVFTVVAGGGGPFGYRWFFNLTNAIPGGTNDTLVLANVQPTHAGNYRVVVTNALGAATSTPATLTVEVNPDRDGDGLPNDWELAYGLNPDDPADAARDADGDGLKNQAEFIAGTNPTNAASVLKLGSVVSSNGILFTFSAVSNLNYRVLFSGALTHTNWAGLMDVAARPTNRQETVYDPAPRSNRFYRIATP